MQTTRLGIVLLAAVLGLGGCGLFGIGRSKGPKSYSNSAKESYDKGMSELKSRNWAEAVRYFQITKTKFGFSKWATLAEIRIADANLGREQYAEAIDGYRNFAKDHPTHELVQNGYTAYKICDTYYQQIPGHWFLLPPSAEKDQGPASDALQEMQAFIQEYPESPYVAQARKRVDDCIRRLAEHELYVASFYLNRNKPVAAIGRLEALLRDYPKSSIEPKVLLLLARTFLKMEKPAQAKETLEKLVAEYPGDQHVKKARAYLERIQRRYGAQLTQPAQSAQSG